MAYSKTNWTDNTTPIDASNLNKIEDALSDQDSRIDTNQSNLGALKQSSFQLPAGATYQLLWATGNATSPQCIMFISARGAQGALYTNLLVNGYGYSSARISVTTISSGSYIGYEIESNNYAIDLTNSANQQCNVVLTCLWGTLPTPVQIS